MDFDGCQIGQIQIPGGVEAHDRVCFCDCQRHYCIEFSEPSWLKLIDWICGVLDETVVMEIRIPDSVEELGDGFFSRCKSFSRVTFGKSLSLK